MMKALAGLRFCTIRLLAASFLALLCLNATEGPWPLTTRAARGFADAYADEPSVHPRDYYLGTYGARCIHSLTGVVTSEDSAERLTCFSGRGIRVALLDTGLCAGITERSRNSVTCTSVIPGVACEDAGCAHGTRSVSVLAGHLAVPPLTGKPAKKSARCSSEGGLCLTGQYFGLAPDATVRVFRVFDRHKRTQQRYLVHALDTLLREAEEGEAGRLRGVWNTSDSHIRRRRDATVDVISLSYGSEDYYDNSQVQDRLYRLMHEYGVIVVAAAGNARLRFGSVQSPADMPDVLAVGALRIERHGTSRRATRTRRTLGTHARGDPAAHALSHLSRSASVLGDLAESFSAGGGDKSVARFSGRGPTTWELPFGAGRAKPDLIALGQNVWAVQGVSAAAFAAVTPRMRHASPALQLRSASGTSIAAPIVAGVVVLCLEAARSSRSVVTAPNITKGSALDSLRQNRITRISDSLRVRAAILRTATPLVETAASPPLSPHSPPAAAAHSDPSATAAHEHPRRVLAGVPLLQLYARYLHVSRVSILAQGAGEVQPLRALHAIIAGTRAPTSLNAPDPLRTCDSFAIPPFVRIGCEMPSDTSSIGVGIPQRCRPPHDPAGAADVVSPLPALPGVPLEAQPAAYWWPFSDLPVYPGATPVLLNISIHLCPSPASAAADCASPDTAAAPRGKAARLESARPYARVAYTLTKVSGYARAREAHPSTNSSCHHGAQSIPLFSSGVPDDRRARSHSSASPLNSSARYASSRTSFTGGEVEGGEDAILGPRHMRNGEPPSTKRRRTQQRWTRRLLRVATELTVVASRSRTRSYLGKQQPSPPPTSFSLSVAISSPTSAHTRLCYDAARETVVVRRERGKKAQSGAKGAAPGQRSANSHGSPDEWHTRNGAEVPKDTDSCVPLLHLFRALDVEGALHIFTGESSSQPTLTVPFAVRVVQPPPRAQRVLIDTSLDWFNPPKATSDLFIAGDDPHESTAGVAPRRGPRRQGDERAYAEANGGDHPHTNLSLLWLYLRHTLGMAVGTFPLLRMSAMASSIEAGGSAALSPSAKRLSSASLARQMAPADALAQVGTLIIVDPELPLTPGMRRLLTHAVLSGGANCSADGLNILLVTEWYSADVAAQLHWTRDENLYETDRSRRGSGAEASEAAADVDGDRNVVRHLRAYRRLANSSTRGLPGSSHVPSWNRWLSEVTAASGAMSNGSGCNVAANQTSEGLRDVRPARLFELSEELVIDGVFVVSAAAPAGGSGPDGHGATTYGGGGGVSTLAKPADLRSLGHLRAAGVLQWRLPAQAAVEQEGKGIASAGASKELREANVNSSGGGTRSTDCPSSAQTVPSTVAGEAVMCNVLLSWAQLQRRLVKRTIVGTSGGSSSASGRAEGAAVVVDGWEDVLMGRREGHPVRIGGLKPVEAGQRAPDKANASAVTPRLTHGILGFLALPPPTTCAAAAPACRFRRGRIAIVTDSDCLSTSDRHAQDTLDELEGLLYPPSASSSPPPARCATWECFARSPDGQRLLQAESTQSSLCVEVVKELLLWAHTGNWHRWRDAAQLHCEARTWAPAAHCGTADTSPGTSLTLEAGAWTVDVDSAEDTGADDLLGTAPKRAHVGEVVWRLWAALMESTASGAVAFLDGLEGRDRFQDIYKAGQDAATAKMMRALMVSYHGDWRVHLEDSNMSPSSTGAADNSYSKPQRTTVGWRSGQPTMQQPAQQTSLINRLLPLNDLLLSLRWMQHPVVLGQLMATAGVLLGLWLWRAWSFLQKRRRQRA
ncbi:hypothetical protein LSCM1_05918 [Leishmania martiniquensis]|uniref:Peptidase S8/S53 domain-containing protein n=1 Tax=Leishmania martiniquensis TaxID=1580590 RepID=A0A836H1G8_9TRYP|nr:hypothetical protein LSCM1_05918 [Leishmania martiniquensis]